MLTVHDLHFRISDSSILNGIDLSVSKGERVGIIGPNGSGKTTLFNCLSGFNIPSKGRVEFKGKDITSLSPAVRARSGLGRLFQNFGIFREMTVLENILVALEAKERRSFFPWSSGLKERKERAHAFLCDVALDEKAHQKAGCLSGGQLRLLEITRLIAFGAELFLFDEPTAGVSPRMKGEIELALRALQSREVTVLIIEHDINFIQRLCDRVVVLDSGRVMIDGTPESVRANPQLQEIYFGAVHAEGS